MVGLFHTLVICHIIVGSIGLMTFWVPVISKKGGVNHQKWGRVFTWCMLITGTLAIGISTCTLLAPAETHPNIPDIVLVRGIFGWMMQYLAILTINLAWYGCASSTSAIAISTANGAIWRCKDCWPSFQSIAPGGAGISVSR